MHTVIYLLCLSSFMTGTIKCSFDADLCNWNIKTEGDDNSRHGFGWARKNSNNIESQGLEGPGQGIYNIVIA